MKSVKYFRNFACVFSVLIYAVLSLPLLTGCGSKGESNEGVEVPVNIDLVSDAYRLSPNGKTEINITALVEDKSRVPVPDGEKIEFSIISDPEKQFYEYVGGWSYTSDGSGSASTSFTVPILPVTELPHILTVQAEAPNGIRETVDIELLPGGIGLSADPNQVVAGDYGSSSESTITATVTDTNGNAVSGEHVNFLVLSGPGQFKYYYSDTRLARATTDSSGEATVTYTSSATPGLTKIRAWVGDIEFSNLQLQMSEEIAYTSGNSELASLGADALDSEEVGSLGLTSADTVLNAGGTNSTSLGALVRNTEGGAVRQGTIVVFSSNLGNFPNGDQLYSVEIPGTDGSVTVPLIAGSVAGTAEITAFCKGVTQKITVKIVDGDSDTPLPAIITLTASPANIPADGATSTMITAIVTDSAGQAVEQGTTVTFSTSHGKFSNGDTQYTTVTPDETGNVRTSLISGAEPADVQLSCYAGGVSQMLTVEFTGRPVNMIVGSVRLDTGDVESINADGKSSVEITATITDYAGVPVPQGTQISFSGTLGTLSSELVETPDDTGVVKISLISSTQAGTAVVTARAGDVTQSIEVKFTGEEGDVTPETINLWADPPGIAANSEERTTIDALIKDEDGKPVSEGAKVIFTTTAGRFTINGKKGMELSTTDDSGSVSVELAPSSEPTVAQVTCRVGKLSQTISVTFEVEGSNEMPASVTLTLPGASSIVADNTSSAIIEAEIKGSLGQPVAKGTFVQFSTSLGRLSNTSVTTPDNTGKVQISLIAGTEGGTAEVVCKAGNVSQKITVELVSESGGPSGGNIVLRADPASIPADGTSQSVIDALITDASRKPVSEGTAIFTTTRGRFSNGRVSEEAVVSDSTGNVNVTLTSSESPGTAVVTCAFGGISRNISVTFSMAGSDAVPAIIELSGPAPESIPADGRSSAVITATVKDSSGTSVNGMQIQFSTSLGTLSSSLVQTSENGTASVSLISGISPGTAEVVCRAGSVSQKVTAEFTRASGEVQPARLSLYASQTTVSSDNSDTAEIIASALDSNNAALEGVTINFSADGGQLSASGMKTGTDGTARVDFSAGARKENRTVFVTASVGSLSKSVPVKIIGSTVELETDQTSVGKAVLTIRVRDAHGDPVYGVEADVTSVDPSDSLTENNMLLWQPLGPDYTDYLTDVNGELKLEVRGNTRMGNAMLRIEALGDTKTQNYIVSSVGEEFAITEPADDPSTLYTGEELRVTVSAPGRLLVKFTTTFGIWKENSRAVLSNVPVVNGTASARLTASEAGLATVQVLDENMPGVSDSLRVAIAAPSSDAAAITLQSSSSSVSPSTGEDVNTVDLVATVRNATNQVVSGAPVVFSLENTTGGGEGVSPVYVLTDTDGTARSKFSSGSLSSGGKGVIIKAAVADRPGITPAETSIVIGGTAGSVTIGMSSRVSSAANDTQYQLPMSVIVSDANGNPVADTDVFLGVWPLMYATGYWGDCYNDGQISPCHMGRYPNEDENRNLILEPGEDANADGKLTPLNSAAGTLSDKVTTDENGVAEFTLTYPKSSAGWVRDEITASVMVSGSETRSTYTMWLGYQVGEESNLPHSPFNTGTTQLDPYAIRMTAEPDTLTADGLSVTRIEAEVTDMNGNPVSQAVVVNFSATMGNLSTLSATTSEGIAAVTLISPNYVGTGTVTGKTGEISGEVQVNFTAGGTAAQWSDVTASPVNLTADGQSFSEITVRARDINGNTVADDTIIVFNLSGGGFLSEKTARTSAGAASVTYTSGRDPGTATISVETGEGVFLGSVNISLIDSTIGNVSIEKGADQAVADGTSQTLIRAIVTDAAGSPIKDGTAVSFETTAGRFTNVTSTSNGVATAMLVSPASVGTGAVTVTAGGISATDSIAFIPDVASGMTLSATPDSLSADGSSTSEIRVLLRDANGNPVNGETVTFSLSGEGRLSAQTGVTSDGTVSVGYLASDIPGTVTVTVRTTGGVSRSVILALAPTNLGRLTATASPSSIVANGVSTSRITVNVKDDNGNNLAGVPVTLKDYSNVVPSESLPNNNIWQGKGIGNSSPPFYTTGGMTSFSMTHTGVGKFTVWLWNRETNDPILLENKAGAITDDQVSRSLSEGSYYFEIEQADGDWFLTVNGNIEEVPETAAEKLAVLDTDAGGNVYYTHTASKLKGVVIIRAESGQLTEEVRITQTAGAAFGVEVSANPESLYANGELTSTISARVRDVNNNLVGDGVEVNFVTTMGTFETDAEPATVLTMLTVLTQGGIAMTNLISPVSVTNVPGTVKATMGEKSFHHSRHSHRPDSGD